MLKSFTNMVSGLVKSAFAGTDPYDVIEVNFKDLQKVPQVCNDGAFYMFREPASFVCVIYAPEITSRAFSLFRVVSDSEAMTTFSGYSCRLTPLYLSCSRVVCREVLQELCDYVRKHPGWSSAHLAAAVGLPESFKNIIVRQQLDSICEDTFMAPLHVAVEAGRIETIQELVVMGVKVDVADKHGDNVFHYAARCPNAKVTQKSANIISFVEGYVDSRACGHVTGELRLTGRIGGVETAIAMAVCTGKACLGGSGSGTLQ